MKSMIKMWNHHIARKSCLLAAAALLSPIALQAGVTPKAPVLPPAEEETPFVTGSLSFMVDTHFISYGSDVWGGGTEWKDALFHPSLELTFNLGGGFSAIVGTWWDVNDKLPDAEIGGTVQEVDVWAGISYKTGDFTYTLLYQEWMYASQSERIVDLKIAYSGIFLNPSLTIHSRVDSGLTVDEGVVPVLGIEPTVPLGPVTLAFPIGVGFATDDYFGGDSGFAYTTAGITATVPLMEHVSLKAGVTYYYTDGDVYPGNVDESFVTGSAGIVISF